MPFETFEPSEKEPQRPQEAPAPKEKKEEKPKEPPYVEHAEAIWKALGKPEGSDQWKALLQLVAKEPLNPLQSKVSQVEKERLRYRYLDLAERRRGLSEALQAVVAYVQAKREVPSVSQEAVFRALARYLNEIHVYSELWDGTRIPSPSRLPPFLTPYVQAPGREKFALRVTEMLLPFQYDVLEQAGVEQSPQMLAPLANELALIATRRGLKFKLFLACLNADGSLRSDDTAFQELMGALGSAPGDERERGAVKLLVGFIGKHLPLIKRNAQFTKTGKMEDLTLGEAIECCSGSVALSRLTHEIAAQADRFLEGKIPEIRSYARTLFEEHPELSFPSVKAVLAPLEQLSDNAAPKEREELDKDLTAVAEFFLLGGEAQKGSVKNVVDYIRRLNTRQQKIVQRLCAHVKKEATIERILTAVFIPRSVQERKDIEQRTAKVLSTLIENGEISLRDAFDLYYFLELGEGGGISIAYKVLTILEKHGHSKLAADLEVRLLRKLFDYARSSVEEIDKATAKIGLTDSQKRETRNVSLYLKERGVAEWEHWVDRFWAFCVNFPEIAIPLGLLTASGILTTGAVFGYKTFVKLRMAELSRFAMMKSADLQAKYPRVRLERLQAAQQEVRNLLVDYELTQYRLRPFLRGGIRRDAAAILRAAKSGEVEKIAKELRRVHPDVQELSQKLAEFVEGEAELRRGLKAAGYNDAEIEQGVQGLRLRTEIEGRQTMLAAVSKELEQGLDQLTKDYKAAENAGDEETKKKINEEIRRINEEQVRVSRCYTELNQVLDQALTKKISEAEVNTALTNIKRSIGEKRYGETLAELEAKAAELGVKGTADVEAEVKAARGRVRGRR